MIAWILFLFFFKTTDSLLESTKANVCGPLYLTLTAEKKTLVLNWKFTCSSHPNTIKMWWKNPASGDYVEIMSLKTHGKAEGHMVTKQHFEINYYPGNWNQFERVVQDKDFCYPYYIESLLHNVTYDWNCFHINPEWMRRFHDMRLKEMFIPGTYSSGAIQSKGTPAMAKMLAFQSLDFWGQAVLGIRYFDIAVGFYNAPFDKRFYIYSDEFGFADLKTELNSLALFLSRSSKEVIIIDLHTFIHFTHQTHARLLGLLSSIFKNLVVPRHITKNRNGPSLLELWKRDRRLIINYRKQSVVEAFSWLWNSILTKNNMAQTPRSLTQFIKTRAVKHDHNETFCNLVASTVTRFHVRYVVTTEISSDRVNRNLDYNLMGDANIVSVAFFEGTNIVDAAILANMHKVHMGKSNCCPNKKS